MTTKAGAVTAEELAALPDDGYRWDLVRGELRKMAPRGYRHGRIAAQLVARLGMYVAEHRLGVVLSGGTGLLLSCDPDTVLAADAAFVRADRVPAEDDQAGFAPLAPDLVVEVVSPGDRPGEVRAKSLGWLEAGTRLVWVLDPQKRLAEVYRPGTAVTVLRGSDVLDGADVLPGLSLPLSELLD